jgi:hypothetical protein
VVAALQDEVEEGVEEEEEEEDPEELVFGSGSSEDEDLAGDGGDGFIPVDDAEDFLPAHDSDLDAPDAEDLEEPARPDYTDVFMPFVHMPHFDHLAYAFLNPPVASPVSFIHQAAALACGSNRVSLLSSSRGTKLAVFSLPFD